MSYNILFLLTDSYHLKLTQWSWVCNEGKVLSIINFVVLEVLKLGRVSIIQSESLFSMHCLVTHLKRIGVKPERHQGPHHQANQACRDEVEDDDENYGSDLDPHLSQTRSSCTVLEAISQANVFFPIGDHVEETAEFRHGEDAGEDSAESTGDGVGVEHRHGVVDLVQERYLVVEDHHCVPGNAS